ncbi:MAG: hypothetical protein DI570_06570 [Phenylobacterium zucineum]|nr:MAG: hypothetical protein DI570_06570 [Phenylobacterium zucineum]
MMLGEALLLIVLALAIMAAWIWELYLDSQGASRRLLRSAAAWTPIIATIIGWISYADDGDLPTAAITGMLAAPPVYLVMRLGIWVRHNLLVGPKDEATKERARIKYRPASLESLSDNRAPARAMPAASPEAAPPPPSEVTAATPAPPPAIDVRAKYPVGAVLVAIAFWLILALELVYATVGTQERDARESLAAALELSGHGAPNIRESEVDDFCRDGEHAYQWGSLGAAGRACVDSRGGVKLWVDRKWPGRAGAGEPSPTADAQAAP